MKGKPKTDLKCRSGCRSRPRWGESNCVVRPPQGPPCLDSLVCEGLAVSSFEKRTEPSLRVWSSHVIFLLDQSPQIPVLLAPALSLCLFLSLFLCLSQCTPSSFGACKKQEKVWQFLWGCPLPTEQLFYSKVERFLFLKQGPFYPKCLFSPHLPPLYISMAVLNSGNATVVHHSCILY